MLVLGGRTNFRLLVMAEFGPFWITGGVRLTVAINSSPVWSPDLPDLSYVIFRGCFDPYAASWADFQVVFDIT